MEDSSYNISITDMPNDVYREIIKLLDPESICNLYMTHKVFWVLTKEQIKYCRVMSKVTPRSRKHDNKMVLGQDQIEWIANKLTEESRMKLLTSLPNFYIPTDKEYSYINISTGIHHKTRKAMPWPYIYLNLWARYYDKLPDNPHRWFSPHEKYHTFSITTTSSDLAELIMQQ